MTGCSIGGGEESELGGSSFHLQHYRLPGRPYVPGQVRPFLSQFFFHLATTIWHLVCQLADMFVCDQDGGTPLNSDLDQGAGEEANSPAGGARGVGGDVDGGVSIFTRKFEDGNRSLFFGGAFVQCDNIPLIMTGGKIQARK